MARSAEQVDHAFRHAMAELMSPSGAQQCLDSQVKVRQFNGRIDTNWGILSYSALAQAGHHAHEAVTSNPDDCVYVELPGGTDENHDRSLSADANSEAQQAEVVYNQFTFPKGANAGTCLHWMFENLDFSQPVKEQQSIIAEGLTKYGFDLVWLDTVSDWMQRALNYQLGGHRLSDIPSQAMKVEMEFYFDFSHLSSVIFGNALRTVGVSETQLERGYSGQFASQGVLKGFIDLTYRVDGKYYVLDYKSNFLGDDIQAYQKGHLEQAMSDHNYFLQALIYLLALHRFLEARLDNYDFDRHIGGALYYFVRGVPTETGLSAEGVDETGIYRPLVTKEAVLHLDNALRNGTENDKTPIAATPLETATGQIGFNFD